MELFGSDVDFALNVFGSVGGTDAEFFVEQFAC
jgi:hypothetical protein